MAYFTQLLALPMPEVEQFESSGTKPKPTLRAKCSHALPAYFNPQPLSDLLLEFIDGGRDVINSPKHPLRPARVHTPEEVHGWLIRLSAEWSPLREVVLKEYDWAGNQIEDIIRVLTWADERREAIVTWLGD